MTAARFGAPLSRMQLACVAQHAAGVPVKIGARVLDMMPGTYRSHVKAATKKLGAAGGRINLERALLARYARHTPAEKEAA